MCALTTLSYHTQHLLCLYDRNSVICDQFVQSDHFYFPMLKVCKSFSTCPVEFEL